MKLLELVPLQYRLIAAGVVLVLLLGLASAGGARLAAGHYRPLLDAANDKVSKCGSARDNLETLAGEQGRKLGELVLAGQRRKEGADKAVATAKVESAQDYAAANRIQQERIGGDQCAAATTVIDMELGL